MSTHSIWGEFLFYEERICGDWSLELCTLGFPTLACGHIKTSPFTGVPVLPLASIPSEAACLLGAGRWFKGQFLCQQHEWKYAYWHECTMEMSAERIRLF